MKSPAAIALAVVGLALVVIAIVSSMFVPDPRQPTAGPEHAPSTAIPAEAPPERAPRARVDRPDPPLPTGAQRQRRIVGRVIDALGQPVAGCTVTASHALGDPGLHGIDERPVAARQRTEADGAFALTPDASGPFAVVVTHPQFPPIVAAVDAAPTTERAADLGDIVLRSEIGLRIEVATAEDRTALPGARVALEPRLLEPLLGAAARRRLRRAAIADDQGRAVFYGVEPGPYWIRAEADGRAVLVTRHEQTEAVRSAPPRQLLLAVGHVLRGRVIDADGRAVDDAAVLTRPLEADDASGSGDRTTGTGGFRLAGLAAGRHRLTVESVRWGRVHQEIEVSDRTEPILVRMPRGSGVAGRVVTTAGAPIAGATVEVTPAAGPAARDGQLVRPTTRSGDDGEFRIDGLPAGKMYIVVSSDGFVPLRLGPLDPNPAAPLELTLEAAATWVGRVLDAAGRPHAAATVAVVPPDYDASELDDFVQRAVTDPLRPPPARTGVDGRFVVPGVRPGTRLRFRVDTEDHAPWVSAVATTPERAHRTDLGDVRLRVGAHVVGQVRDADGHGRASVTVCAEPVSTPGQEPRAGGRTRSGPDGDYTIGPLAAGWYDVFYYDPDRETAAASAQSRSETRIRIELTDGVRHPQNLDPR